MICTLSHILLGRSHQEDEVDRKCGMHGREKKCVQGFGGENLKDIYNLEVLGRDGRIILKWI